MTSLPPLEPWDATAHSLHEVAQLLGAIRQLVREPRPNYLELALVVERGGLSTGGLPGGGSVRLDFGQAALIYTCPAGQPHRLALAGHSQVSLFEALLAEMADHDDPLVTPAPGQSYVRAMLEALDARGHVFKPRGGELVSDAPLEVDPQVSAGYGDVLFRVFSAVARFRAGLEGVQTPIVVWPEHFDLSTLWFPGDERGDSAPQLNIGFAPFDGAHRRPYLYAYTYPMPEGFAELPLPGPAGWNTAPWQGLILHYDDLRAADDPEALIEESCAAAFRLLTPGLKERSAP